MGFVLRVSYKVVASSHEFRGGILHCLSWWRHRYVLAAARLISAERVNIRLRPYHLDYEGLAGQVLAEGRAPAPAAVVDLDPPGVLVAVAFVRGLLVLDPRDRLVDQPGYVHQSVGDERDYIVASSTAFSTRPRRISSCDGGRSVCVPYVCFCGGGGGCPGSAWRSSRLRPLTGPRRKRLEAERGSRRRDRYR